MLLGLYWANKPVDERGSHHRYRRHAHWQRLKRCRHAGDPRTLAASGDFAISEPIAAEFKIQVSEVIRRWDLPWSVEVIGSRCEYLFCPQPRNGVEGRMGIDNELHDNFNLFATNRGIILAPFADLVQFTSSHLRSDVELHTEVFEATIRSLCD